MIDATLYLVGKEMSTDELIPNASSCSMCKRMIINSGIKQVIIRNTPDKYTVVPVSEWVENDESLDGVKGY